MYRHFVKYLRSMNMYKHVRDIHDHVTTIGTELKITEMPRKIVAKQCSSQESLALIHQCEGHSNRECIRNDNSKIVMRRRKIYEVSNRRKILFKSKRSKIQKLSHCNKIGPLEYVFYSILNTSYNMDQGTATAAIARGLIALNKRLDSNSITSYYLDKWSQSGENIIILEGVNNKHLKYLYKEAKYSAIDLHFLHQWWSNGRDIIVLTVFGLQENLQEIFEGLLPLR
ncbi:uncharacterized protein LOC124946904 isoform X1 [Vespa velutina]|uniref:uncharacterized protein LOC124946904 isoform X1 n=2 Tax=Vespa velutina TaxID=202808 RepID=UPI001FB3108A|nr:uncharacterized protein LOC124946904 isoform X1 [Vespa velutina]